jgi:hypothetical protein
MSIREKLFELIKSRWVSTTEIKEKLGLSDQQLLMLINNSDYPIAEEKRKSVIYYKVMNKGDYE